MKLNDLLRKMTHKPSSKRFIEIDMLRGLAISLMIFGHILWDLDYFNLVPINNIVYSALQKTVPPLFFIIVGISLIVSKKKSEFKTKNEENKYYKNLISRGIKIFGLGMIITLLSLIFLPNRVVFFGVLHCIGISIILSVPFLKYRNYNFLFSLIIIFTWTFIGSIHVNSPSIIHLALGFHQIDIWQHTVDYFPLIPWFGVCLLGITIGDWLYCGNTRIFKMIDLSKYRLARFFSWVGQHSLGIYLIHQPLITGFISLYLIVLNKGIFYLG